MGLVTHTCIYLSLSPFLPSAVYCDPVMCSIILCTEDEAYRREEGTADRNKLRSWKEETGQSPAVRSRNHTHRV